MPVDFLNQVFLNNTLAAYGIAIAILIAGFILIQLVRSAILSSLQRWEKQQQSPLDQRLVNIFSQPLMRLLYIGTVYIAIANLNLHPILGQTLQVLAVLIATVTGIQFLSQFSEYLLRSYLVRKGNPELEQSFNALTPLIRAIFWAVGFVFLLDNLGFDISAVVASLGIGGLAIAFAAQGILQDLFSYFSIVFDRPFAIGDFIVVGDYLGTVEQIGIKTTRLKSLSGEQLILANTDLTSSRVRNFKRMEQRRIVFTLGVIYETSAEKLKQIPAMIENIIQAVEGVKFDRAHFASYGDFSLNYEVVYLVNTGDFNTYMNCQQQINFALFEAFAAAGIEFAYPTQVHYLQKQEQTDQ